MDSNGYNHCKSLDSDSYIFRDSFFLSKKVLKHGQSLTSGKTGTLFSSRKYRGTLFYPRSHFYHKISGFVRLVSARAHRENSSFALSLFVFFHLYKGSKEKYHSKSIIFQGERKTNFRLISLPRNGEDKRRKKPS